MFGLGTPEVLVVTVVALIVLGPKRLPGLVRQVGKWVGKARVMANQFREQLESEINLEELASMEKQRAATAASTPPPPSGLDGQPVPVAEATPDYGTYPYAEPSVPPEAESEAYVSVPPLDAVPAQHELALNEVTLQPDPAAPAPAPEGG